MWLFTDEWAIVGEFQGAGPEYNSAGRLGDISGRPNEQDLQEIEGKVRGLIKRLGNVLELSADKSHK